MVKSQAPKLELDFGAFAPRILSQLDYQGYKIGTDYIAHWQTDADAITRLRIRQLLTEKETERVRKRLLKKIAWMVARK